MERCQHFSIRGYVAEMRQKEPQICFPFSGSHRLEPLNVPHFRYWRCDNCLRDIGISGDNDQRLSQPMEMALEDPASDESIALMALLSLNSGQETDKPQDPKSSENPAGPENIHMISDEQTKPRKKTRKRRLDEIYRTSSKYP